MKETKKITVSRTEALIMLALLRGKTKDNIIRERGIVESTWFGQIGSIREKLTGGWNDESALFAPRVPSMSSQIIGQISELLSTGRNPLVQKDVISSRSLMLEILKAEKCRPCEAQVSQALKEYGLVAVGRVLLVGQRHYLWALPGIDRNHAAGRVHARLMGQKV